MTSLVGDYIFGIRTNSQIQAQVSVLKSFPFLAKANTLLLPPGFHTSLVCLSPMTLSCGVLVTVACLSLSPLGCVVAYPYPLPSRAGFSGLYKCLLISGLSVTQTLSLCFLSVSVYFFHVRDKEGGREECSPNRVSILLSTPASAFLDHRHACAGRLSPVVSALQCCVIAITSVPAPRLLSKLVDK